MKCLNNVCIINRIIYIEYKYFKTSIYLYDKLSLLSFVKPVSSESRARFSQFLLTRNAAGKETRHWCCEKNVVEDVGRVVCWNVLFCGIEIVLHIVASRQRTGTKQERYHWTYKPSAQVLFPLWNALLTKRNCCSLPCCGARQRQLRRRERKLDTSSQRLRLFSCGWPIEGTFLQSNDAI